MKVDREKAKGLYARISLFLDKCSDDNVPALAAQSAFFLILSAIPFMMFSFSVAAMIFGKPNLELSSVDVEGRLNPVALFIIRFVERSVENSGSGMTVITAVAALWSAGKGIYCITEGISRIYRLPNKHIWLTKRIFAMGYTLVLTLVFLLGIVLFVVTVFFIGAIREWTGGLIIVTILLFLGVSLIMGLLITLMLSLAMKMFLGKKVEYKRQRSMFALIPGMALTVVAWNILTLGVIIYTNNFATSSIYGSLSTVIVFMIWIYFMMYLLLYGIQLDYLNYEQFYRLKIWNLFKRKQKGEQDEKESLG